MDQQDIKWLDGFDWNKKTIDPNEQRIINSIYDRCYNTKVQMTNCADCLRNRIAMIKDIYDKQQKPKFDRRCCGPQQ